MHQDINSPRHPHGLRMRILASKSPMHTLHKHISLKAHGKVYQFALMKENVHCGAHALTGRHVCCFGNNVFITER